MKNDHDGNKDFMKLLPISLNSEHCICKKSHLFTQCILKILTVLGGTPVTFKIISIINKVGFFFPPQLPFLATHSS